MVVTVLAAVPLFYVTLLSHIKLQCYSQHTAHHNKPARNKLMSNMVHHKPMPLVCCVDDSGVHNNQD